MQITFNPQINNVNKPSVRTPTAFYGVDSVKFSERAQFERNAKIIYDSFLNGANIHSLKSQVRTTMKKDEDTKTLKEFVNTYKNRSTKENKIKLLEHENKMLWDELEKPELTFVRNFDDFEQMRKSRNKLKNGIYMCNIEGLNRAVSLNTSFKKEDKEADIKHIKLMKNVFDSIKDNEYLGKDIRTAIIEGVAWMSDSDEKTKFFEHCAQNTKYEDLKSRATSFAIENIKYSEEEIKKIALNPNSSPEEFENIITKENRKFLSELLPSVITDKNRNPRVRRFAVLAASKCQSPENYQLLKEIATNKEEKDLLLRRNALNSLAFYMKSNHSEISELYKNVINEKSDLSPFANRLLEKIEGRFHKDMEAEVQADKTKYKNAKSEYVEAEFKINKRNSNFLDKAFFPLKNALIDVADKTKTYIIDDTITLQDNDLCGVREFEDDFINCGAYWDAVDGISNENANTVNKAALYDKDGENTFAHEFAHSLQRDVLSEKETKQIETLFNRAKSRDEFMDEYSSTDDWEYFAQGYEAYIKDYAPHNSLYGEAKGVVNDRLKLKLTDPDLYSFIEHCIKKYG